MKGGVKEIMENKILELLERKGSVSMNDDIFPLVEKKVWRSGWLVQNFMNLHTNTYHSCCSGGAYYAGLPWLQFLSLVARVQQFGQMVICWCDLYKGEWYTVWFYAVVAVGNCW